MAAKAVDKDDTITTTQISEGDVASKIEASARIAYSALGLSPPW